MTKRDFGKFARSKNDLYETTDPDAVKPLLPHLTPGVTRYIEPCFGNGALTNLLDVEGIECYSEYDVVPIDISFISFIADARTHQYDIGKANCFITNPPWSRNLLHPIIENLSNQLPTWLLFDADWMHTKQAAKLIETRCVKIVSVGRVCWMGNGKKGFDNAAWYLFDDTTLPSPTQFFGKQPK